MAGWAETSPIQAATAGLNWVEILMELHQTLRTQPACPFGLVGLHGDSCLYLACPGRTDKSNTLLGEWCSNTFPDGRPRPDSREAAKPFRPEASLALSQILGLKCQVSHVTSRKGPRLNLSRRRKASWDITLQSSLENFTQTGFIFGLSDWKPPP